MAGFLGARVQLLLSQPPNAEVHGTVQDIVAGQALSLIDVYFPATGTHLQTFVVQSSTIADVKIIPGPPAVRPIVNVPQQHGPPPVAFDNAQAQGRIHVQYQPTHTDPAILSYDRTRPRNAPVEVEAQSLPIRPAQQSPQRTQSEVSKKKQRLQKPKIQEQPHEDPPVVDTETSRHGNDMNTVKRGKGWRQTPLLQPSQQPSQSKKPKKQKRVDGEAQNGWATEDATDIQDMGEFDFEANHKLFDKQQVFDDLRKGDTTADEDRLVSHNKTGPRKNLLPSENVLSPKVETLDKGSDADTEVDFNTGRSSSRQSGARKQQSRTNSNLQDPRPHVLSGPPSSERLLVRSATASSRTGRPLPVSTPSTLRAGRTYSPHSATSTAATNRQNGNQEIAPALVIAQSKTLCQPLYPSALAHLEQEACSRYGLSSEAVTENAGRSIAEQALSLIDTPAEPRRGSRANTFRGAMTSSAHGFENTPPVIVVLAAPHLSGARALVAARHLSSRGYKIIVTEGAAAVTDEQYTKQSSIIKKMIRAGAHIKRGAWPKANDYIKNLKGPPVIIIDALLAGTKYEDTIEGSEGEKTQDIRKTIDWANRSRAAVLSVTSPSGLSDHDGSATIVDGEPLAIKADKLIALGAPVTGVLEALKLGERFDISLADIGINIALKAEDAVAFGPQWIVPLSYIEEEQDIA